MHSAHWALCHWTRHLTLMRDEAYLPPYNAEIDAVNAQFGLLAGPDLYAWFITHLDQLADGVHPTAVGSRAINLLWAQAVRPVYP